MNFLIVNGPNLNLLGTREPQIYGNQTFLDYLDVLRSIEDCVIEYVQSNVEGEIINALQASGHDGIILNAGGYTHTSVAIRDCIAAISVPVVEVHISNLAQRESFRHDDQRAGRESDDCAQEHRGRLPYLHNQLQQNGDHSRPDYY